MRWYFAAGTKHNVDLLIEEGVKSILISFAYCKKGLPDALLKGKAAGLNVFLDSGGFTNTAKPGFVTLEEYTDFLKSNKKYLSEYTTLDAPRERPVTMRNYRKMLEQGFNPMLVDHQWFPYHNFFTPEYAKGEKMAWGGWAWHKTDKLDHLGPRVRKSAELSRSTPTTKIHLLGVGQRIRRFLPYMDIIDSFDAATWIKAPQQYGRIPLYEPPDENHVFPKFRQLDPLKPHDRAKEKARAAKLDLKTDEGRVRMTIRELKSYYAALESFYSKARKDKIDLEAISLMKVADYNEPPRRLVVQVAWAAGAAEFESQARTSEAENALTVGQFFHQPSPSVGEVKSIGQFVKALSNDPGNLSAVVQKQPGGVRHQVHKDGDSVRVLSENGNDNTERLPSVVDAVKALKPERLILDVSIEKWIGRQRLEKRAVDGHLSSSESTDAGIVASVVDVMYLDGDLHSEPTASRMKTLKALGIGQSEPGVPSPGSCLNALPGIEVSDLSELEKAIRVLREMPGSAGVIVKQAESAYPLSRTVREEWIEYRNAVTLRCVVMDRSGKGPGWIYRLGLLASGDPEKTEKVGGEDVVSAGKAAPCGLKFVAGDVVLVEAGAVKVESGAKGESVSVSSAEVVDEYDGKADTLDAAAARAKRNLVLSLKRDGKAVPLESVVQKQADPYLEVPPETPHRFTVQQHWRGKSVHSDLRSELRRGKSIIGWTLNTQLPGVVDEPVISMAQARALAQDMSDYSKINWATGDWPDKPLLAERKKLSPFNWLSVQGKTKTPEPGEAPVVGGTANFPGVFLIVDSGKMEYGAQKEGFHEYFLNGRKNRYRVTLQQVEDRWLASRPDDLTPYVLSPTAVSNGWMPPVGVSALPAAVRAQVPEQFRYWTIRSGAKQARDALVAAIKAGDVKLDQGATYRSRVSKADEREAERRSSGMRLELVMKGDPEKREVTGVVMEPDTVDAQGDTIDPEAIARSAHKFLSRFNQETELGLMHRIFGNVGLELYESWTAPIDLKLGGQTVKKGSWLMTVHVLSDSEWAKVKSGETTGFSIGGVASVV